MKTTILAIIILFCLSHVMSYGQSTENQTVITTNPVQCQCKNWTVPVTIYQGVNLVATPTNSSVITLSTSGSYIFKGRFSCVNVGHPCPPTYSIVISDSAGLLVYSGTATDAMINLTQVFAAGKYKVKIVPICPSGNKCEMFQFVVKVL